MNTFRSLLVTGGAGFIGSHFIRHVFTKTDFSGQVYNLDKLTYAGNPANLADIERAFSERYKLIHGDIADAVLVKNLIKDYNIDGIVHFAAESHVDRSITGPVDFLQTNVVGTYTLLEAVRAAFTEGQGIRFHHVSTDEVFGSLGETGFFTENTPYDPKSPYSATKAASDHLVRAWAHTYGLPVTLSNCSNNYGPYHFPEKLIPLTLHRILEGQPIPVYGDGQNIRDWLFVEDHAEAIWMVLAKGLTGESYNVGGRSEHTNLELVKSLCQITAKQTGKDPSEYLKLITFVADRPGHDRRYAIDSTKIETELGWRPKHNLDEGLELTVRWYLENRKWVESITSGDYKNWINENYLQRG